MESPPVPNVNTIWIQLDILWQWSYPKFHEKVDENQNLKHPYQALVKQWVWEGREILEKKPNSPAGKKVE